LRALPHVLCSEEVTATPDSQDIVFISYASVDKADADAVVTMLERSGVPCWIAPRDIPYGAVWPEAIADAIARCRLFLLLFSPASDRSDDVFRELANAGHQKKKIFPVRIRQHDPQRTAYYLEAVQWFDAFEQPLETYAAMLAQAVQRQVSPGREIIPDPKPRSESPRHIRQWLPWLNGGITVVIMAIVLSLLLQLFFYAAGVTLLRGAAYWLVLAVCALVAWGVQHLWNSLKRRKESPS
jgi:TIR domain